jgi:hypothetical protein
MCPLSPLHQNLTEFLGEKKVLYLTPLPPTPRYFFLSPFFSCIFKPTRRKPSHSLDPAELVLDSETKAAPLVGSGNRGHALVSVSYRNFSAALSLIYKVCNSIYSKIIFLNN